MRMGLATLSRNTTVVQRGDEQVLVNSVRLGEQGLVELERLGQVTDVIRRAGARGSDAPFYKQRYGATIWDVAGQRSFEGSDFTKGRTDFHSDHALDGEAVPPLPGAGCSGSRPSLQKA